MRSKPARLAALWLAAVLLCPAAPAGEAGADARWKYLEKLCDKIFAKEKKSGYKGLNERERVFYLIWCLEGQWQNGGLHQFYWNSSGNRAEETVAALEAIKAPKSAAVLRKAAKLFKGGSPTADWAGRRKEMQGWPAAKTKELEKLDAYTGEELMDLLHAYMTGGGAKPTAGSAEKTEAEAGADYWVEPMRRVRARFKGRPGTFAHFGDSITYSMAYWAALQWKPGKAPPEIEAARQLVSGYMKPECWRAWKGAEHGNMSGKTVRWALEGVDGWLEKLNPEVALIMFGTNDLRNVTAADYEAGIRKLVEKCLAGGTVVVLSTIPPRSGYDRKAKEFAETVRKVAREKKVPLIDFHAEVLKRRPEDWDGRADKFKAHKGYDVPTLIARDGVHPSNPAAYRGDYTAGGLKHSGFNLRNYLSLMKYAEVIEKVLKAGAPPGAAPGAEKKDGVPSEPWFPRAPPLPAPAGQVIKVSNVKELFAAAAAVRPGGTIMVAPGTYRLTRRLGIATDNVTLRGATGRRNDVVLDGGGIGELVAFTRCSGVTVADLTIQNVRWNGFKIDSQTGVHRLTVRNCVIHNVWQRGVKGVRVPREDHEKLRPAGCRVEYCLFYNDRAKRFSDDPADTPGRHFDGNYIAGIDVMYARGWTVSDNVFIGIQGRTREGRGAVFLWHEIEGCTVERNVIVDCDAGICLGNSYFPKERGLRFHARGCLVRNNFVTRAPQAGIFTAYTRDCKVLHNTVHDPKSRLRRLLRAHAGNDGLLVAGNIFSGPGIRKESESEIKLTGNLIKELTAFFLDPVKGNLRLRKAPPEVAGRGRPLAEVPEDIDGRKRGARPDLGAHQAPRPP